METKFNFNSQICTSVVQSERLLALGLKKETADMVYRSYGYIIDEFGNKEKRFKQPTMVVEGWESKYDIPAWSLHRLMILAEMKGSAFSNLDSAYETTISIIAAKIRFGYFNKEYLVNQDEIEEHCKGVLEYLDYIRGVE